MKQLSLQEANKLLKSGKIIRQSGPDNITIRKLWKDCYHLVNVEQKVSRTLTGLETVNLIRSHRYYYE